MKLDIAKVITIAALIIIIACFLPWWGMATSLNPTNAEVSVGFFLSSPFYFDTPIHITFFPPGSSYPTFTTPHENLLDNSVTAPYQLLIAVITTLIGGIIGLLSFRIERVYSRKRIIAFLGGFLAIVGVILYIVFLGIGIAPAEVNYSEFGNRNLNLIFGSNSNMIDMFIVQYYFDHIFGVSIGWFLALIFGAVLLLAAYKAKD